jgi:hypothetical protein
MSACEEMDTDCTLAGRLWPKFVFVCLGSCPSRGLYGALAVLAGICPRQKDACPWSRPWLEFEHGSVCTRFVGAGPGAT